MGNKPISIVAILVQIKRSGIIEVLRGANALSSSRGVSPLIGESRVLTTRTVGGWNNGQSLGITTSDGEIKEFKGRNNEELGGPGGSGRKLE